MDSPISEFLPVSDGETPASADPEAGTARFSAERPARAPTTLGVMSAQTLSPPSTAAREATAPAGRAAPAGGLVRRLRWPAPALLAWLACWLLVAALRDAAGASPWLALATGIVAAAVLALAWPGLSGWRRLILGSGFPVAMLGSGLAQGVPAWIWLLPLALLLVAYPLKAWRDAPLFPTPPQALQGLARQLPLPPDAAVLDAGCGLGQGLRALHAAYPMAHLHGIERSWPLRLWCGWRCPWARVRQGDMWAGSWAPYAMVYLFQRPESMERAITKARAEMVAGGWLVSLEFEAVGHAAHATQALDDAGRMLWIYRIDGSGKSTVEDSS